MVCTADDLQAWRDFPKGLRVLLLDGDNVSAAEIKSKLEEMDYLVYTFCNEDEALSAISSKPESFHVAIVEVSTGNSHGSFRFLETVKDLPTIMISSIHCLSTMMKCIALGAAEVLQKPLSDEKLRNIWQHVVHKAFNAGGSCFSKSLKPVKETVASMLQLKTETEEAENGNPAETENVCRAQETEQPAISDKFTAPSTPQLKQGARSLDDMDCQDQPNCSIEKDGEEQEGESKSVETTCNNLITEATVMAETSERPRENVKEEGNSANGSNAGREMSPHLQDKGNGADSRVDTKNQNKASPLPNFYGTRSNKKKMKVDWTPELHKRFVQAVEQLGVDQAIPSRILELMKVEGLTRHNVASHLQKFRMHRRHILPKEGDRRFPQWRDPLQRGYPQKPFVPFPPYYYNQNLPTSQSYPVWGHPSIHPSAVQMWGSPAYPTWQPTEACPWKPYPPMQADAWGCPVVPPSQGPCPTFCQNVSGFHGSDAAVEGLSHLPRNSSYIHLHPAEEVIDKVVKEAISKPWLPLPLGLRPPSTESVLSELHRQGISAIPPPRLLTNSHSC